MMSTSDEFFFTLLVFVAKRWIYDFRQENGRLPTFDELRVYMDQFSPWLKGAQERADALDAVRVSRFINDPWSETRTPESNGH